MHLCPSKSYHPTTFSILRDYNDYVLRNLSRGYTRHDLGVSLVKEQQLRVRKRIQRLSEGVRRRRAAAGGRVGPPRLFPRDVEAGLKDFATGVEALMDKVITGELGDSMARQASSRGWGGVRGGVGRGHMGRSARGLSQVLPHGRRPPRPL